jgi:hypothetical protein
MKKLIVIALTLVALLAVGIAGSILAVPEENIISNQIDFAGVVENAPLPPSIGGGGGSTGSLPINVGTIHVANNGFVLDDVEVQSTDMQTSLSIPQGTTAKDKNGNALRTVRIDPLSNVPPLPENNNIIGIPYEFSPSGATFNPAIEISFKYDDIPDNTYLTIVFWNGSQWIELTDVVVKDGMVIGKTTHFTKFALISVPKPIITPTVVTATPTATVTTTPTVITTTPVVTTTPIQTTTPVETVTPTETTSEPTATTYPTPDNNRTKIIVVWCVVVLIVVVLVAYLVKNRKKK